VLQGTCTIPRSYFWHVLRWHGADNKRSNQRQTATKMTRLAPCSHANLSVVSRVQVTGAAGRLSSAYMQQQWALCRSSTQLSCQLLNRYLRASIVDTLQTLDPGDPTSRTPLDLSTAFNIVDYATLLRRLRSTGPPFTCVTIGANASDLCQPVHCQRNCVWYSTLVSSCSNRWISLNSSIDEAYILTFIKMTNRPMPSVFH
jgi:hypothetical protein